MRKQLASLTSRGRHLVTVEDAANRLDVNRVEAAKTMARWAEQGWLRRVRRGLYIAVPVDVEHPERWSEDPMVLATVVWEPCYFTGWTAGNYWGLTEQVFKTVVLKTTKRVRSPSQTLLDHRLLIGRIAEDKLSWGLRTVWIKGLKVRLAVEARVIIDVLGEPKIGGGIRHGAEMLSTYLAEHDRQRLLEYGDRFGNRTVFKRLGFLCESLGLADGAFLDQCAQRISSGTTTLDPSAPKGGVRNSRWGLRINVRFERPAAS